MEPIGAPRVLRMMASSANSNGDLTLGCFAALISLSSSSPLRTSATSEFSSPTTISVLMVCSGAIFKNSATSAMSPLIVSILVEKRSLLLGESSLLSLRLQHSCLCHYKKLNPRLSLRALETRAT